MSAAAQIRTAFRSAVQGATGSPVTSLVAAATIGLCLLLVGAFALLVANMERLLDRFGEDIRVSAYLSEDLDAAGQAELLLRVSTAPGVESVELVTKEQALARFRESQAERAALLDGLEENPLPASLEIALAPEQRNAAGLEVLGEALDGLPGIAELGYGHEWIEGYQQAVELIEGVAFAIGGVLGLATLVIVANTIRLSIYARREEIEIVQLVGGSRSFMATPFLLEGAAQGIAGGVLGLVLLYAVYQLLLPGLSGGLELLLGYAEPVFLGFEAATWLVAAGALLGVTGSALALVQDGTRG